MIPQSSIRTALKQYKRLRREEPTLTSEEASAILIAASSDAVAQAIYSGVDLKLSMPPDLEAEQEITKALQDFFASK